MMRLVGNDRGAKEIDRVVKVMGRKRDSRRCERELKVA